MEAKGVMTELTADLCDRIDETPIVRDLGVPRDHIVKLAVLMFLEDADLQRKITAVARQAKLRALFDPNLNLFPMVR